ncbi:E3 ubiquitin-protein ligase TRIM56-like [Hydractinia symbiolongicarpus]|uniref:E3 ubiquitin-protein ligase TRIM56-like n=1 Tax=Hydractinia symbiolongicarpus TaxID=13093 RepID=UPI00254C1077|nr:E3 ubiquitin-protein ligase TRIM56-like [Hydractinia symbiolongicarpus]
MKKMSAAKAKQLSVLLECKVCMDTYHKPKTLNCGHTYCQDCLDSMLVFNDDGSAELQCPLRCSSKTTLGPHETTSSLMTTYLVTDILNELSNVKKVNLQCQQGKECKQIIRHSCTTCSSKICDKCETIHSCPNKSFNNVIFNQKLQQLQPLCKQHDSLAKFVCIDCENMFVCVYCTHRQHKNHERKSIAEFGQEARTWFWSFITSFEDTKVVLESLTKQYDSAFKNIEDSREVFVRELGVRKLKRMEEYMKKLNTEEINMLKIFDQGMEDFKTKVIATGFVHNTRIHEFSDYVKEFTLKCPFELVAEKIEIEERLRTLSSFPRILPTFNLHLGHLKEQDYFTYPLGKIAISFDDIHTADPCGCSVYKSVIDKTENRLATRSWKLWRRY